MLLVELSFINEKSNAEEVEREISVPGEKQNKTAARNSITDKEDKCR